MVYHFQIPQTSILKGYCIIMSKTELLTNLEIGALIVWGFMPYHLTHNGGFASTYIENVIIS